MLSFQKLQILFNFFHREITTKKLAEPLVGDSPLTHSLAPLKESIYPKISYDSGLTKPVSAPKLLLKNQS